MIKAFLLVIFLNIHILTTNVAIWQGESNLLYKLFTIGMLFYIYIIVVSIIIYVILSHIDRNKST